MGKPKAMTPEEFFANQNMTVKDVAEQVRAKPKKVKVPQACCQPKAVEVEVQTPVVPTEVKVDLIAKSQVYLTWVYTMLIAAVTILVGILYPFPVNIAVFSISVMMILLSFYTMRKFMKR